MSKHLGGGIYRCFVICLGLSALTVFILAVIMAAILTASADPTGRIGIFSLATLIVSAVAGGLISSRLNSTEKIGFCLTVALAVSAIMLISGVILSGGHLSGGSFMNYGCYFGIFSLVAYLGCKRGKGSRRRRKRLK